LFTKNTIRQIIIVTNVTIYLFKLFEKEKIYMAEKKQFCFIRIDKKRLDYFKKILYNYIIYSTENTKKVLFQNIDDLADILHQLNGLFISDFKYLKLNYAEHFLIISIMADDIKKFDNIYKNDFSFFDKINLIYELIHSFDC